jgi:hypothetical protein
VSSPGAPADLAAVQRRLWRLLVAPEGVRNALAEEGPGAEAALGALLVGDERAGAAARLEVYANAYFARLHDVLRADVPALAAALGPPAFHDLATAYLLACPPRHFSLRHAGDQLAAYLASDEPGAAFVRARCAFAADLAALELARTDAFDAADDAPLSRDALAALAPEAWAALTLRLRACVRLLALAWPVDRLVDAQARGEPLPLAELAPARTQVCVYREGDDVRQLRVPPEDAALLARARDGVAFGEVCEVLASPERAAAFLGRHAALFREGV